MSDREKTARGSQSRRWFLAWEPFFEAGRRGRKAQAWEVEGELVAIALFGDVTLDLSQSKRVPAEVTIDAYALVRDVEVLVPEDAEVELSGGVFLGDLTNEVPEVRDGQPVVRVRGHALFGDVNVRRSSGDRN